MPIQAQSLVRRTRELLQLLPNTVNGGVQRHRDGFPDDTVPPSVGLLGQISILSGLNEWVAMLSRTRIRIEQVPISVLANTNSAPIPNTVIEVLQPILWSVTGGVTELYRTTAVEASLRQKAYLTARSVPTHYIREGANITLVPGTSTAGTVNVTSVLSLPRYTDRLSTNVYIPEAFQDGLPYGAACILALIDADDGQQTAVYNEYKDRAMETVAGLAALYGDNYDPKIYLEPRTMKK